MDLSIKVLFLISETDWKLTKINLTACDPWGGANFEPMDMIGTIFLEVHQTMLHTKYLSSIVFVLRQDYLEKKSICKTCDPRVVANFDHIAII